MKNIFDGVVFDFIAIDDNREVWAFKYRPRQSRVGGKSVWKVKDFTSMDDFEQLPTENYTAFDAGLYERK